MNVHHLPERRRAAPYIPAGCDQQGRLIDGQRAAPTGIRAPLPNSVGRWARVLIGGVVLLFAFIGAFASLGAAWHHLTTESPAKAVAPAKVTT